ncbi:fatty acid hydroxylase [Falsiroseomonas bella]|uniref:Fatty acid hydroxylase n=1 Tax=Falsiroseomonas bella TaxID=2184016 RepID=A0A317FG62_9PROT|nr:sterol desaturase family protein [Falsiroseomonas bella]PWS37563.1 fatty acid hydroxylase [Falsiroseomonas bella]
MLDPLIRLWVDVSGAVFEGAVQPALYAAGLMMWADDVQEWLDFALLGIVQIVLVYAVCRPLEAVRPVEPVSNRAAVLTDVFYTLLARLGLLPLIAFVLLSSAERMLNGWLADAGFVPPTLETLIPALREMPLLALLLYVLILDFGEYWRHRFQHMFGWWYALHSVHHAQRQMTFWTDDRNHLLDDAIAAVWFGAVALLIGVPPAQFVLIVMLRQLAESLSHANVRLSFGRVGERLLVSPRFHRIHHGELSAGEDGRNYAVLLPVWDWIFGTADFDRKSYPRTGDPNAPESLATGGWLRQQIDGFRELGRALRRR